MRTITCNTYTFPGSFYNTDSLIHRQSIRAFDPDQAYMWGKLGVAAESIIKAFDVCTAMTLVEDAVSNMSSTFY